MGRQIVSLTRPLRRGYGTRHPYVTGYDSFRGRPVTGPQPVMAPLPAAVNGRKFLGMDPSDPLTYVRPWNPRPGMIARLNFDGAAAQGRTAMGGTWRNPPSQMRKVAGRPKRRPR
jgi:hypothetical protein